MFDFDFKKLSFDIDFRLFWFNYSNQFMCDITSRKYIDFLLDKSCRI